MASETLEGRQAEAAMISLVGISHHTAPIELRERIYVDSASLESTVRKLMATAEVRECVVLSTCNRTEIYLHATDASSAEGAATRVVAARAGVDPEEAARHLYRHHGFEAVQHLFRVAAGLDSLVVGEAEILGQVGDAYELGVALPDSVGPVLHRLFQSAKAVGGAVRSETRLGHGAASIPSAAVRLAVKVLGSLKDRSAIVLGAGDMGVATLRCLLAEGVTDVIVASRTLERARETTARIGGRAVSMAGFWETIPGVDILVTSTAATEPVVGRGALAKAREASSSPLVILDIALPRDVEPDVGDVAGVFLYNIDDLQKVVGVTEESRRAEVADAERLVSDHAERFWRWYCAREVTPIIRGLRDRGEAARHAEMERLVASLQGLSGPQRERIDAAMERLMNKLLHPSAVAVRRAASDPGALGFLEGLTETLGLDEGSPEETPTADSEEETPVGGSPTAESEGTNQARG